MKKVIFIGTVPFEVKKPKKFYGFHNLDLLEAYKQPSRRKVGIYNDWWMWSRLNNVKYFGIESYNGFMFTLSGEYETEDGIKGRVYITKTRQEFYPYFS